MRLNENRTLAWVVLAACVLGSVFGLGGASLARERNSLEELFFDGTQKQSTGRDSMDAYLDRAAECVQVMVSEAQLLLGNDNRIARTMLDTLAFFGDENSLDERYAAYAQLQAKSDELYNAVYAGGFTDAQRVNFKRAYDDFWGCDKYVRLDPYREAAAKFNRNLDGFPASLAAGLMGVEEINSFGA